MLYGKKTYIPLKKDPKNVTQNKVNNLIKLWKDSNYILNSLAKSLKADNLFPARFYGLSKIHKPNYPLRPIVFTVR